MKRIVIFLIIILQMSIDDCQQEKAERKFYCNKKPAKEHYEVMSYFLQNYLPKENLVYIDNISDDLYWIFDNDLKELLDELLNFLGEEEKNFLKNRINALKDRRCNLEKRFSLPYRYKLVSPNFIPKQKKMKLANDQGDIIINIYDHPIISLSLPIFTKDKEISFICFNYARGPSWGYSGWALLEREFDYWRTIKIQVLKAI